MREAQRQKEGNCYTALSSPVPFGPTQQVGGGAGNALDALHGLRSRLQDLEWHLLYLGVVDKASSSMDTPPQPPPIKIQRKGDHNSNRGSRAPGNQSDDDDDDDDDDDVHKGVGDLDGDEYGDEDADGMREADTIEALDVD